MNTSSVNEIVNAVLYEGYILYPYRASSVKNQRERFTFGRVYPKTYSESQNGAEPCIMQTECLAEIESGATILEISARFLQPLSRVVGVFDSPLSGWKDGDNPDFKTVPELRVGEKIYRPWLEAIEREVQLPPLNLEPGVPRTGSWKFRFEASQSREPVTDGETRTGCKQIIGVLARNSEAIEGEIQFTVQPLEKQSVRVTIRILNLSQFESLSREDGRDVLSQTFASTHTILRAQGAAFVSMMDTPEKWKNAAAACKNIGTWPVLVGSEENRQRDTLLSSPIILYDYPQIAPESPGDLFDSSEIDELLTLRILTMTDQEKREAREVDAHARRLLERTEALSPGEFCRLHGTRREPVSFDEQIFGGNTRLEGISCEHGYLKNGDRVRIRPRARADVMDMALAGRTAVIEAVEQDAEQKIHLALVLDDDPGRDLGLQRQPGHRFFFGLDEVEVVK